MERDQKQKLEIYVEQNLPNLRANNRLIFQIIINLVTNAVKFTPEVGKVSLKACLDKLGAVEMQVTVIGIGIALHHIEKVIEPFEQIRNTFELSSEATGWVFLYQINSRNFMVSLNRLKAKSINEHHRF